MISRDQKNLINYCLDKSFYCMAQSVDFSKGSEKARFIDYLGSIVEHEFWVEVRDSLRGGSAAIPRWTREQWEMIRESIGFALEFFSVNMGKARLDVRLHRVKIRDVFNTRLASRLKSSELYGLEQARKYLEKEKEKLAYGEN